MFGPDGSFVKLIAEGETVLAGGGLAAAVDEIYGDRLPGTLTLRTGGEPESPGQGRLFDTGEDDERFKSVRERPAAHTTVLSVSQAGHGISLTVVKSDYSQLAESDEFLESVIDELHEKEVHPPWESGEGLAGNVEGYLGDGSEIPSEFYENRYDWDELIEPHNEYWAKEFKDDVRKAVKELLGGDEISLQGGDFPNETVGEVVAAVASDGVPSVVSPHELAAELADSDEFKNYEEAGYEGVDSISGPIIDEIRETWRNRQMMRQDDKKFDAMRKALDAPVDLPPNSDAVLRMLGAFKDNGWDAMSFRELAMEFPEIARQERFWKAIAKGSPKLTPDRLRAYLDGNNPKAAEALPKSFGAKAVNPPKYRMVAEKDYEGYTISNVDEHMLGVAALYVEEMNEEDTTDPEKAPGGQPPPIKHLITDAMRKWHVSAHPLSDSRRGIGWIRYDLVEDDEKSVMFIQEVQSDFMWAVELAAAGQTPRLGAGFPDSWDAAALHQVQIPGEAVVEPVMLMSPRMKADFNKKLARYILKKFQGWDHYLLGNLITTARRNGVDRVVMNTSRTVKLNPASAPRSEKKLRWYDELAKDFGFGQEQGKMYGHDEKFHSRAASRSPWHRARLLIIVPARQNPA